MPIKYKAKYSGRIYANKNDAIRDNASYLKAKRLTEQTKRIPLKYIGGKPDEARAEFWRQEPVLQHAVDSIAGRYGIDSGVLKYRIDHEGFTDKAIQARNVALRYNTQQVVDGLRGYNLLHNRRFGDGVGMFGLDDVGMMIKENKVHPINEVWRDTEFVNEKRRTTNATSSTDFAGNAGLTAATLKYFKDEAKKDFPNASDEDLNRYSLAYFNRGKTGGRKWVKSGAKGYNYKRSLEKGGK